ncbi:MAG: helix-turn-helix transcriptional regulator [Patescibacteria group bacterium]
MKTITIKGLKFVTFEEVLKKQMKLKGFKEGYEKEVARLNMIYQIKQARLAKKMTQKSLAKKADMPQSVIARLESGRQGLSFNTISKIATALDKKIQLV